jgi:iron complex transport system substrate-binding protein
MHNRRFRVWLVALALEACAAAACGQTGCRSLPLGAEPEESPTAAIPAPQRIISLVPAATEMLFAIGAGSRVVAVSSFDRYPREVRALPRVGALLDPDLERIIELAPDLVVVYATQADLREQLTQLGIPIFVYSHAGLEDILATIERLGTRVGSAAGAEEAVSDLQARLESVESTVKTNPRPRTMLVFEREPSAVRGIYASGGVGFLNDILQVAGGENVFAGVRRESLQATAEMILAAAPDVIIELEPEGTAAADRVRQARQAWQALPAVPAVAAGRVYVLVGDQFVVAGPRVADAAEQIARALHPGAFGRR